VQASKESLMGEVTIPIWLPVPVAVFGVFLGVLVVYTLYSIAKWFVSLITG
jgi:hypothetical protein